MMPLGSPSASGLRGIVVPCPVRVLVESDLPLHGTTGTGGPPTGRLVCRPSAVEQPDQGGATGANAYPPSQRYRPIIASSVPSAEAAWASRTTRSLSGRESLPRTGKSVWTAATLRSAAGVHRLDAGDVAEGEQDGSPVDVECEESWLAVA